VAWRAVAFSASEWVFLAALVPIAWAMTQRFPLRRPGLGRSIVAHLIGALLLCAGWAAMGIAMRLALGMIAPSESVARQLAGWMLTSLPWSVFMYFTIVGCLHAAAYWLEARDREAHADRLAARLAESRLDALRMQLNPHFLFNSLNAVTVLVRDQRTRDATRMLERLGDVLRQVLRTDQPHEVTLAEELRILEQYLAIEQVRFSDRLQVSIAVDEELRTAMVPVFALQPLVENALRHGVASTPGEARVAIRATREGDELVLVVADDGSGADQAVAARGGVGLANTRERLTTLYGARASLGLERPLHGGTVATVRLPLRYEGSPRPRPDDTQGRHG